MSARLLALAEATEPPSRPWLSLTEEDRGAAAAWLDQQGIAEPFIVVAPGSRWGTKRWPGFPELAARLPCPVAVLGGAEDREVAESMVRGAPGRCHSAAGSLGLRASAALVERAALLVTNDSVALHMATALARPVVAIFGPTIPAFGFGPLDDGVVVEHGGLSCRPCSPHGPMRCPLGHHRCMRDIAVARVERAVLDRLGSGG